MKVSTSHYRTHSSPATIYRQAVNSNGLFGPVSWVLGVSTNGDAPSITGLSAAPIDAKTNATELSLTMNAPGVSCRVWYTVTPLQNTVLLEVDEISAEEVVAGARPDGVIDLPQARTYAARYPCFRVLFEARGYPRQGCALADTIPHLVVHLLRILQDRAN